MAVEIYVRNLPENMNEESLKGILPETLDIREISFLDDPNPNTTEHMAVILVEMPFYDAEQLANRYNGRIVDGKELRVVASLYNTLEDKGTTT